MSADESPPPVIHRGHCKWFNFEVGYGFIERPDAADVFVHCKHIKHSKYRVLYRGEPVEFQIRQSASGRPEAVHVTGPGGTECSGNLMPRPPNVRRTMRCFNCRQVTSTHVARDCPMARTTELCCHVCHSAEHLRADCPEAVQRVAGSGDQQQPNPSDSGIELDTSCGSEANTSHGLESDANALCCKNN